MVSFSMISMIFLTANNLFESGRNPFISVPDNEFVKRPLLTFDELLKDEKPFKKAQPEQTRTIQVQNGVFYDVYGDDTVRKGFYYVDDQAPETTKYQAFRFSYGTACAMRSTEEEVQPLITEKMRNVLHA